MQVENKKNMIVISGRVDSSNAEKFESDVFGFATEAPVVIDAEKLEYISSAGLRVLMKLKKKFSEVIVKNVNPEVYEILDMTGFTNILTVKKALKQIDITGLEIIGRGATGVVYRLDDDKILKLFFPGRLLYGIEYEKEAAKYAFMLGIPTAIAYSVVKSGESYGIIYELVNSKTLFEVIEESPEKHKEYAKKYVDLLNEAHKADAGEYFFPMKSRLIESLGKLKGTVIPELEFERDLTLFDRLKETKNFIHGDAHPGNVMVMGDELIFIDMTSASTGDPMFDIISLGSMISLETKLQPREKYLELYKTEPQKAYAFWREVMKIYFNTEDEAVLDKEEKYIEAAAAMRMMLGVLYMPGRFPADANTTLRDIMNEYFDL